MTTVEEIPVQFHATSEQHRATVLLHYIEWGVGDLVCCVLQAERISVDHKGVKISLFLNMQVFWDIAV